MLFVLLLRRITGTVDFVLHWMGGAISALRVMPDGITVRFAGSVHGLTLGRANFARELRPTLIEYLFHQQTVGFLWGAVTFLWGMLWSARRLLLGT
jgi:hypothetical protein